MSEARKNLTISIEMCLWRCLPWLAQTGMGAGKTPEELKEERSLVIGARIWLTVCAFISYYGRADSSSCTRRSASGFPSQMMC